MLSVGPVPSKPPNVASGGQRFKIPPAGKCIWYVDENTNETATALHGYLPADFQLPPSQPGQEVSHEGGSTRAAVHRNVRWGKNSILY